MCLALSHADTLHAAEAHLLGFSSSCLCSPAPLPLSKPNPVSWQSGERAVGLRLCLRSLGFLFFFFLFSRTEIVRAAFPSPRYPRLSMVLHAKRPETLPDSHFNPLTLLAWLLSTNTVAREPNTGITQEYFKTMQR